MIDRINATLDVYSHLRVEVALRDGTRARQRAEKNVSPPAGGVNAESERRAQRSQAEEPDNIIQFAQSSADGAPENYATGEEVMPALEASVLPRDPQMAMVARLYRRTGRAAERSTLIGTRLNAVA
ncbi:MAG TPA: hypothetical protein VK163_02140 [Opitutaceae bacterium]|nr:hypothetical protein [Opitutaceae bacterium]